MRVRTRGVREEFVASQKDKQAHDAWDKYNDISLSTHEWDSRTHSHESML